MVLILEGWCNLVESYNQIYETIIDEVSHLLALLDSQDTDDSIQQSKELAISQLTKLNQNLIINLESLQKNADWNTFTIAFYGETNAGKSTLIEILRILLEEPSKLIERETYIQALNNCSRLQVKLEDLNKNNELLENERSNKNKIQKESIENIRQTINDIEDKWVTNQLRIFYLNERILNVMASSLFGFFKVLFRKLDIQKEVDELGVDINKLKIYRVNKITELHNLESEDNEYNSNCDQSIKANNQCIEDIQKAIIGEEEKLMKFSDGKIIGATNDFTKEMQSYSFKYNDISFNILDLPGIEGKEELVINEIEKAIEKAHVIFYVTRRPHAPQSGGTEHEGTIEKIKKQLSTQSEVYLIYNKGIKNPRAIKNEIINSDEEASLNEADQYMVDAFGENYVRHISLSAYPAYIAIANEYSDQSKRSKDTFFKQFTANELLEKSKISTFYQWIQQDLIKEYKKKIIKANFKKIRTSINQSNDEVKKLYDEFDALGKKVKSNYNSIKKQLHEQGKLLKSNIEDIINSEIESYISNVRKSTYKSIDSGINDKDLTNLFKKNLKIGEKELEKNIQNNVNILCNEYKKEINTIINRYERYLNELKANFFDNCHIDIISSVKIETKSKGKILGVLNSIFSIVLGIILNSKNDIGLIILGLVGGIVILAKEVYSFFDSNYKKGQQKKSIDNKLDQIKGEIRKTMSENVDELKKEIDISIVEIVNELKAPINDVDVLKSNFNKGLMHLIILSDTIDKEERLFYENDRGL